MPAAEGVDRGGYVRGRARELTEMAKGRVFFFYEKDGGKTRLPFLIVLSQGSQVTD